MQSGKGEDLLFPLDDLCDVVEQPEDHSMVLVWEDPDGRRSSLKLSFPSPKRVLLFFREVLLVKERRIGIMREGKVMLIMYKKGVEVRAANAAYDDVMFVMDCEGGLEKLDAACAHSDNVVEQPNPSTSIRSHMVDAHLARDKLDILLNSILELESGLEAHPACVRSSKDILRSAHARFRGKVRRVLDMVSASVVCDGPLRAAALCRKLRGHQKVSAIAWRNGFAKGEMWRGFRYINAHLELQEPRHVVEVQVQLRELCEVNGAAHESTEWARAFRVPVGMAPGMLFRNISKKVKDEMERLVRLNWNGLARVLPQILQVQGKMDEAEEILREEVSKRWSYWEKVAALTPGRVGRAPRASTTVTAAVAVSDLGLLLHARGKMQEAEDFLRMGLNVRKSTLGRLHPLTCHSYINLAGLLREQ
ncbi:unnamed protein product, partial [Discosporangium mesarthrocarpum]